MNQGVACGSGKQLEFYILQLKEADDFNTIIEIGDLLSIDHRREFVIAKSY